MASRTTRIVNVVPPWGLAMAAMLLIQLGAALSVPIFDEIGPAGTVWLRLSLGAAIALLVARPSIRSLTRTDVWAVLGLGASTGMVTVAFSLAIDRIPLGTTVSIEFLGPLTVAAIRSHSTKALVWPAMALAGVLVLTEPWGQAVDLLGAGFALLAAVGWGLYIVFTHRVGNRLDGIDGLALMLPIAALVAAPLGVPEATGHLTAHVILQVTGLAILMPLLPFALEMQALRTMSHAAFGTLMAIEPAFGALLGAIVLGQFPNPLHASGIALVIAAGIGSQRAPGAEAVLGDPEVIA